MGFIREAGALAGRKGIAILSVSTTVPPVALFLFSENLALAIAFGAAVVIVAALWAAHEFWKQRNEVQAGLQREREAHKATPEFRIDAVLQRALDLREALTYNRHRESEKELRVAVLALIFESQVVTFDAAPAYADDLATEPAEGTGTPQLLAAVNDCYRVLAAVRKQL